MPVRSQFYITWIPVSADEPRCSMFSARVALSSRSTRTAVTVGALVAADVPASRRTVPAAGPGTASTARWTSGGARPRQSPKRPTTTTTQYWTVRSSTKCSVRCATPSRSTDKKRRRTTKRHQEKIVRK